MPRRSGRPRGLTVCVFRRVRGAAGRYTETVGSPSIQNRQATSAAALTPTRGPVRIALAGDGPPGPGEPPAAGPRMRSGEPGSHTSTPSRARSMARAWQSRAGPRARSWSARAAGRRSRASETPSMMAPARSRTASADALGQADEVDTEVHAVGEVDVGVAGRPEHDRVAPGRPAVGVRRGVGAARVGLGLGQPDRDQALGTAVLQNAAEQVRRDVHRRTVEERARQHPARALRRDEVRPRGPAARHWRPHHWRPRHWRPGRRTRATGARAAGTRAAGAAQLVAHAAC